jgi:hypothetical protein
MPVEEPRWRMRYQLVPWAGVLPGLRSLLVASLLVAVMWAGMHWYSQPEVGALTFTPHVVDQATTAVGVLGIAVADVDGDGDLDIVTAGNDDLKVYENVGSAIFEMKIIDTVNGQRVQVVDLDNDGDLDLLVTLAASTDSVRWYEQTSRLEFNGHVLAPGKDGVAYAGDLNGDGKMDVATAVDASGSGDITLSRWMNGGGGEFTETVLETNTGVSAVTVGDIDGNGYADIVMGGTKGLQRWKTSDGLTFTREDLDDSNGNKTHLALGDLNGDNRLDIVTGDQGEDIVAVYHNEDNRRWNRTQLTGSADALTVVPVDLDEDGDGDVLVAAQDDNTIYWYEDTGDAGFVRRTLATKLQTVFGVAVGDIDGDGDWDVVAGDHYRGTVYWYERLQEKPVATVPSDMAQATDGSGIVTFSTTLSDEDRDTTSMRVQYSTDGDHWYKPWLKKVTTSAGSADLVNSNGFQVGSKNAIDTNDFESVKLTLSWDTKSSENTGGPIVGDVGTVQVRIIPRDQVGLGNAAVSKKFRVDNAPPAGAKNLQIVETSEETATLKWEVPTDSNAFTYHLYYGVNHADVLEKKSEVWEGSDAAAMNDVTTDGAIVEGLSEGQSYTFKLFVRDVLGNETAAPSVRGVITPAPFAPTESPVIFPSATPSSTPVFTPSPGVSPTPTISPVPSLTLLPTPTLAPIIPSVLDGNRPPVADAGPDQVVNPRAFVVLDGTASVDIEGESLTYSWKQIDGPLVNLSDDRTVTPSFSAGGEGETYIFALTVRDTYGATALDMVTVVNRELPLATTIPVVSEVPSPVPRVAAEPSWLWFLRWINNLLFILASGLTILLFLERFARSAQETSSGGALRAMSGGHTESALGRVVHYQTGQGIAGAEVLIYDTEGKLRMRQRTNDQGGFSTFFPPGQYTVAVQVEGFTFASTAAVGVRPSSGLLYTGGALVVTSAEEPIKMVIPMKPAVAKVGSWKTSLLLRWQLVQRLVRGLSWPIFLSGALLNTFLIFVAPGVWHLVLEILYVILVLAKIVLELKVRPAYGLVRDAITHIPLDLVAVRLLDAKTNRLVMTRVTDAQGRFFALPPAGYYNVVMGKPGYAPFIKQGVVIRDERNAVLQITAEMMPVAPGAGNLTQSVVQPTA